MILELKGTINEKLSTIKSDSSNHTTNTIVTIIVGFIVAFLGFYFSAIGVIEKNVEHTISEKIHKLEDRIIVVDEEINKLKHQHTLDNKSNVKVGDP